MTPVNLMTATDLQPFPLIMAWICVSNLNTNLITPSKLHMSGSGKDSIVFLVSGLALAFVMHGKQGCQSGLSYISKLHQFNSTVYAGHVFKHGYMAGKAICRGCNHTSHSEQRRWCRPSPHDVIYSQTGSLSRLRHIGKLHHPL